MVRKSMLLMTSVVVLSAWMTYFLPEAEAQRAQKGTHKYDAFEPSERCGMCHKSIAVQYQASAMAKSQVLPWDQAEYFKLALPHTRLEPKVAPVEAGCINCHAPQAFLAGDVPPPRAGEADSKADGVSCDLCHSIVGFEGDTPVNGNFAVSPGKIKYGSRKDSKPMGHQAQYSSLHGESRLCGTCHDETSPYGAWVKETYREWSAGPYSRNGIQCIHCHLPKAPGKAATTGPERPDVAQHLFQGAYSETMLNGAATLYVFPSSGEADAGSTMDIMVVVSNNRAGHRIPTGSTEERQLWLRLEIQDSQGKTYHIQATPAPGDNADRSYSVTSNKPAYRDLGKMMGIQGFKGIARDALPEGDRLFRKVFLNPDGEETIAQWYTANTDAFDNRLKPLEAVVEQYSWAIPKEMAKGIATITATLRYRRLPQSVADLVGIGNIPVVEVAKSRAVVLVK